jgi:hypothetical protein
LQHLYNGPFGEEVRTTGKLSKVVFLIFFAGIGKGGRRKGFKNHHRRGHGRRKSASARRQAAMARRKAAAARQNAAHTGRKFSVSGGPADDDEHGVGGGGGVVIISKLDTTTPSSGSVKGNGDRADQGSDYAEEPADDAFAKAKQGKKNSDLAAPVNLSCVYTRVQ